MPWAVLLSLVHLHFIITEHRGKNVVHALRMNVSKENTMHETSWLYLQVTIPDYFALDRKKYIMRNATKHLVMQKFKSSTLAKSI